MHQSAGQILLRTSELERDVRKLRKMRGDLEGSKGELLSALQRAELRDQIDEYEARIEKSRKLINRLTTIMNKSHTKTGLSRALSTPYGQEILRLKIMFERIYRKVIQQRFEWDKMERIGRHSRMSKRSLSSSVGLLLTTVRCATPQPRQNWHQPSEDDSPVLGEAL